MVHFLPLLSHRQLSSATLVRLPWLLLLPLVFGCGEENPLGRRAVYGDVSYQGKPVDYGSIQFIPVDPQRGVSSGAMIEAGKYQIQESLGLPPGNYSVMVSSPDQSQQTKIEEVPGDARTLAAERIPAKYNLQTTLKVEVPKARGRYEANFDLQ
jgi:hypothetical protein